MLTFSLISRDDSNMQMHEGFAEGSGVAFCPEWSKSAEKADVGRQTHILGSGTFCPFEVPDPENRRVRNHLGGSLFLLFPGIFKSTTELKTIIPPNVAFQEIRSLIIKIPAKYAKTGSVVLVREVSLAPIFLTDIQ